MQIKLCIIAANHDINKTSILLKDGVILTFPLAGISEDSIRQAIYDSVGMPKDFYTLCNHGVAGQQPWNKECYWILSVTIAPDLEIKLGDESLRWVNIFEYDFKPEDKQVLSYLSGKGGKS